jgi:hypothetical protein
MYEAKFERYLTNKQAKKESDKRRSIGKKQDFDIWTKDATSPSKHKKRFVVPFDPVRESFSGKYT